MVRFVRNMSTTTRLLAQSVPKNGVTLPPWLHNITQSISAAPKLYAWTPENLPNSRNNGQFQSATPKDLQRRIFILGIGNLGRLYANSLGKLGEEVPVTLVLHRKSLLEHWVSEPGIELTRHGVTEKISSFDVEWWTEEAPAHGPVREVCGGHKIANLLVATKAPDALPQVDRLRRYLDWDSTVGFVQNGMNKLWPPYGAIYSEHRFPPRQHPNWLVCVTTHGVFSLGTFKSVHAAPADIAMGLVLPNPNTAHAADYLMEQIGRAPELEARKVPRNALWVLQLEKLIINSLINPLTAVIRCMNGHLFDQPAPELKKLMDILVDEASQILQALAQHPSSKDILSGSDSAPDADLSKEALVERFSAVRLNAMLQRVGEKVKDNRSSMCQDVMAGKQTEVREFNGSLVQMAEYLGLEAPNHKKLCELVEGGVIGETSLLEAYFGKK